MSMRTQNPCYSQGQHDALQRSTDRRKHLNYLLHDYSEENKRVYGDAMPTAGSLIRPIKHKEGDASFFRTAASGALQGAAAESRQLAAQVNNRRTQIGQFYTTVNPSLFERAAPPATYQGTNLTQTAVAHLAGSAGLQGTSPGRAPSRGGPLGAATGRIVDRSALGSGGQQGTSPGRMPGEVTWGPNSTFPAGPEGGHPRGMGLTSSSLGGSGSGGYGRAGRMGTAGESGGTAGGRPSWLLPWQTGDRQMGRAMAEAVRGKRTPIGAFANHDLAKANK